MRYAKRLAPIALVLVVGCGFMGLQKPIAPPTPRNSLDVWVSTQIIYKSALAAAVQDAKMTCPNDLCGPLVSETERDWIEDLQVISGKGREIKDRGEAVLDGDYTLLILELNKLTYKLGTKG